MTKTQEQNWDSVLEGGEKLLAPKRVDVSILQQAKEYNIGSEKIVIDATSFFETIDNQQQYFSLYAIS